MDSGTILLLLAGVLEVGPWELVPKLGLPPNGGDPLDPPGDIHANRPRGDDAPTARS